MKKRIAVLLMAAVFSVTSLNLSAASIEQSAGAGVEDVEEKEEEQEEPAPETPDEVEPETPEATEPETTEVTESETPEVAEPETTEVTEPETPEESDSEASKELSDVEKLQKRIDALPDKDELSSMEDEQLETVYQEISDIYDLINELEDEDKLDLARLQNAAAYFTEQVMALDESDSMVAKIGDQEFNSLQVAIDKAGDKAVIVLTANTTEDVIVPEDKLITIDLNGKTLTNDNDHTIFNKGTLTIKDNGEKGTVDNTTHARAALYNEVGATVIMDGGTFTRSKEAGKSTGDNGGNSYYALLNHGTMTINEGVSVILDSKHSSLLENGWQNGNQNGEKIPSVLTINGGVFKGGLNTIKNDDYGELVINNGTFTNEAQHAVMNWNVAEITGGTFSSTVSSVIWNEYGDNTMDKGQLTITGGTFTAPKEYYVISNINPSNSKLQISGGTYSSQYISQGQVQDYCVEGFMPIRNENGTYGVEIPVMAEINDQKYPTLQDAVDAATDGDVIRLVKDTTENIKINVDKNIVLDLNGYTLNGGAENGKAALLNYGTVMIKDTSTSGTGSIRRDDNGTAGYYVIDNQGTMTIESGNVYNNSGTGNGGASLVRNAGEKNPAILNITGGTFHQDNFIVIKNDDYGILNITGGTITSAKESAVQNWSQAVISGGTLEGYVYTSVWNDNLPASKTEIRDGAVIRGTILANQYSPNQNVMKPQVLISGGTLDVNWQIPENQSDVQVSGGTFTNPVDEKYCVTGFAPQLREDGKYGIELREVEPIADMVFVEADADKFDEEQNEILEQLKNINDIAVEGSAVTEAVQRAADQWNENLSANLEEEKAALLEAGIIDQATADSATASVYPYVRPYLYMEVQDIDVTNKVLTVDMEMRYALIASTSPDGDNVITTSMAAHTEDKANAVILKGGIGEEALLLDIQGSVDITLPHLSMFTSTKLSVKHTKESGAVYYYTSDAAGGTIQFVNPHGFSEFQIREERKAVVSYQNASGTVTEKTYTDADIDSTKIEADSKDGYLFEGWQYAGVEGTYRDTVLTEALLDKLAAAYEQNGNKPVTASPVFTATTAQINITMGMLDKDGKELKTDRTFYAAVFTDKDYKNLYGTVLQFAFQNSSKASAVVVAGVPNDGSSRTFYVTETDKNGNPIQGGKDFGYEIIVKGGTVTLAKDGAAEVTITNKEVKQSSSHKKKSHSSGNSESSAPAAQPASVASAQTGDNSPVALLFVLCIGALSGIVIIMHSRKKKSN